VSLPVILIIFSPGCDNPIESISHYYYARSGTVLTVILSLVGVFLILYTKDFVLSSTAGIFALCVVFFPTSQLTDSCSVVKIPGNGLREGFHYFSAVVFLVILTVMTLFHFTKLDEEQRIMGQEKVKYKWLFQLCGVFMTLALAIVAFRLLGNLMPETLKWFIDFYDTNSFTFWMEVVSLEAFGIAWLFKGMTTVKTSEFKEYIKNHKQQL
jgi:hypothetical protein